MICGPRTLAFFSITLTFTDIQLISGVILLVGGIGVLVWLHRRPPRGIIGAVMTAAMGLMGALIVFSLTAGTGIMLIATALKR
jgi:hypothetical protein